MAPSRHPPACLDPVWCPQVGLWMMLPGQAAWSGIVSLVGCLDVLAVWLMAEHLSGFCLAAGCDGAAVTEQ